MERQHAPRVRRYISEQLSRHERLVLILYYNERLTTAEIALALELSEPVVSRVLAQLQAQLKMVIAGAEVAVL